jgi:hypothetical protein
MGKKNQLVGTAGKKNSYHKQKKQVNLGNMLKLM